MTDYKKRIANKVHATLSQTDLNFPEKRVGKVRDSYRIDSSRLLLITTDRQSAFDRLIAQIPYKGAVLNLVSSWWFQQTATLVPNHLISIPHPQASIVTSCTPFPIEFVVRGYITGTTDTSLWTHYQKGVRSYCGNTLPEGLQKNQVLDHPMLTPTTKEAVHDRPISPEEIVSEGWMSQEDWDVTSQMALTLFTEGQKRAQEHNLILVDTKYEFGRAADGTIMIIDEMHTPDSSRYWIADTYEERCAQQKEPENIDKEFLRLYFREICDPYNDPVLPEAPEELIIELAFRYITLYEMITGEVFPFDEIDAKEEKSLQAWIQESL